MRVDATITHRETAAVIIHLYRIPPVAAISPVAAQLNVSDANCMNVKHIDYVVGLPEHPTRVDATIAHQETAAVLVHLPKSPPVAVISPATAQPDSGDVNPMNMKQGPIVRYNEQENSSFPQ
jgi:hypothetical protein